MYDIEVIEGHSYAVICEGSRAYMFLKSMNNQLMIKKLASQPGDPPGLTTGEILPICQGYKLTDLERLRHVGLLEITPPHYFLEDGSVNKSATPTYDFTEYGLEVMRWLKEHGGDVEIPL